MSVLTDIKSTYQPMSLLRCNWADRPAASSYTGGLIQVADVGLDGGVILQSDGNNWVPSGSQVIIAQTNPVAIVNSTTLTNVTTNAQTIPGNFFHPCACLRLTILISKTTTSDATIVLEATTGNIFSFTFGASTVANTFQRLITFQNSRSSQTIWPLFIGWSYISSTSTANTSSVDFGSDQLLRLTVQNSAANFTTTVAQVILEYLS